MPGLKLNHVERVYEKAKEFRIINDFIAEQKNKGRSDRQLANIKLSKKRPLIVGGVQYQLSHSFLLILDQNNNHQLTPLLLTHGRHQLHPRDPSSFPEPSGLLSANDCGRIKRIEDEHNQTRFVKIIHIQDPETKLRYRTSWLARLILTIKGFFKQLRAAFAIEVAILSHPQHKGLHAAFTLQQPNLFKRFLLWLGLFEPKRYIVMPDGAPLQTPRFFPKFYLEASKPPLGSPPRLLYTPLGDIPLPMTLHKISKRLDCAEQLAKAYANLHVQRYAHLDIKGENIMIAQRGSVTIATPFNFSVAAPIGKALQKGMRHKTAVYTAPELQGPAFWAAVFPATDNHSKIKLKKLQAQAQTAGVKDNHIVTGQEDVYSLGMVCTLEFKLNQLGHAGLNNVIQEMTQPDPNKRPTMKKVHEQLQIIRQTLTEQQETAMEWIANGAPQRPSVTSTPRSSRASPSPLRRLSMPRRGGSTCSHSQREHSDAKKELDAARALRVGPS
jgi:hypothetical protein